MCCLSLRYVALTDLIPFIGIPMLIMTGAVSYDAHNRNKYAAPWFLLVSITGLFGALFYYITIRTEETAESAPTPSNITNILLPILSILGVFCAFGGIVGILGGSIFVASLYGFPAIAIAIPLYYDFSFGNLGGQRIFLECIFVGLFGAFSIYLLMSLARPFLQHTDIQGILVFFIFLITTPLLWYGFRKRIITPQTQ
jgi:hypothetical protein